MISYIVSLMYIGRLLYTHTYGNLQLLIFLYTGYQLGIFFFSIYKHVHIEKNSTTSHVSLMFTLWHGSYKAFGAFIQFVNADLCNLASVNEPTVHFLYTHLCFY